MTSRPLTRLLAGLALLSSLSAHAASDVDEAQAAWARRDQPGQTEKAIQLWQTSLKENPNQPDLWIDLTRAIGRAVRHTDNSSEKKKLSDQGRAAAEQALAQSPQNPKALAYYGEATGQWASAHKGPGSLRKVREAVESLKKAVALKPDYAYAHMLLAEFYRQAPAHISVGDKKKALEEGRLAATTGPDYAINHVAYARALIDNGQKERAIAELRAALALKAPADAVPETKADQQTARELLQSLGATDQASAKTTGGQCSETSPTGSSCGH